MKTCASCLHSIFNEQWGEYKCKLRKTAVRNAEDENTCQKYEPKDKKKGKDRWAK